MSSVWPSVSTSSTLFCLLWTAVVVGLWSCSPFPLCLLWSAVSVLCRSHCRPSGTFALCTCFISSCSLRGNNVASWSLENAAQPAVVAIVWQHCWAFSLPLFPVNLPWCANAEGDTNTSHQSTHAHLVLQARHNADWTGKKSGLDRKKMVLSKNLHFPELGSLLPLRSLVIFH